MGCEWVKAAGWVGRNAPAVARCRWGLRVGTGAGGMCVPGCEWVKAARWAWLNDAVGACGLALVRGTVRAGLQLGESRRLGRAERPGGGAVRVGTAICSGAGCRVLARRWRSVGWLW